MLQFCCAFLHKLLLYLCFKGMGEIKIKCSYQINVTEIKLQNTFKAVPKSKFETFLYNHKITFIIECKKFSNILQIWNNNILDFLLYLKYLLENTVKLVLKTDSRDRPSSGYYLNSASRSMPILKILIWNKNILKYIVKLHNNIKR